MGNKQYFKKRWLNEHYQFLTNDKPYTYDAYENSIANKNYLTTDGRIDTNAKYLNNEILFCEKSSLDSNLCLPSNKESYICDVCDRAFSKQSDIESHKRSHLNDRPFSCGVCAKAFRHKYNLNLHYRAVHQNDRPFSCGLCDKAFRHKYNLTVHYRLVHLKENPYFCNVCKKTLSSKQALKDHYLIHTNEKPHSCDVCKKAFRLKQALKEHYYTHTNERPYACNICGKAFSQKFQLKQHNNWHYDNHIMKKTYMCDICGMAFTEKNIFTKHYRTHKMISVAEVKCSKRQPGSNFKSLSSNYYQHMNKKAYACDVCGQIFSEKSILTKHYCTHKMKSMAEVIGETRQSQLNLNSVSSNDRHSDQHMNKMKSVAEVIGETRQSQLNLVSSSDGHSDQHINKMKSVAEVIGETRQSQLNLNSVSSSDGHSDQHMYKMIYTCNVCSKVFTRKNILTMHYRTHNMISVAELMSGERPTESNFSLKPRKVKDVKKRQNEKTYTCKVCCEVFTKKCVFNFHCRTHKMISVARVMCGIRQPNFSSISY